MMRPRARNEHQTRRPNRLAVHRWRSWGIRRSNDLSCHEGPPHSESYRGACGRMVAYPDITIRRGETSGLPVKRP
jgi:hypothetical protein